MPSILEDPSTRIPPPPSHTMAASSLKPRPTTLPKASNAGLTLYPIANGAENVPRDLVRFLHAEFSAEIVRGGTYPMEQPMELDQFASYWFGTFAVVAVLDLDEGEDGEKAKVDEAEAGAGAGAGAGGLREGRNWEKVCLGTFYIKPNYPEGVQNAEPRQFALVSGGGTTGSITVRRCSHICNAGFLTTTAARGKGVGQQMGEAYLHFAPQLGYKYSVFNLVFANNPASIRIWEKLGFSVIGRVPKAARLANSEELVDALIFGRELGN
ncbi:N-acetyltransferase MPR1 [Penicillium diatomitis]|uniref:N-acetyltransferase MPR1 n=1 Tax=Penicillium diatomitis TaxID=2819901 RepID=A0A9W9XMS0_9EURO|nr:N-acetyltransferase MPR1 [Penicillium diatomitis]KAJ5495841.1 N-acetyltransferase MPR1 [Penicillium diatomitis]